MSEILLSTLQCTCEGAGNIPNFPLGLGRADTVAIGAEPPLRPGVGKLTTSIFKIVVIQILLADHETLRDLFSYFLNHGLLQHRLTQSAAFPFHHFLEDLHLLLELILFGLESDDLLVVELVTTEDLVVQSIYLLLLVSAHVLDELLLGQLHGTVDPVDQSGCQLLLFFSQLFLFLDFFQGGRFWVLAHRGNLHLLNRNIPLLFHTDDRFPRLFGLVGLLQFLKLPILHSLDEPTQLLDFVEQFYLGVGDDQPCYFLQINFILLIEQFNKGGLHLVMLFDEFLVQGLALIQRGLAGLQNSSAHPAHQFDYFLERNDCALVLLDDIFLLSLHVGIHFDDFGDLLVVVEDLIIDEEFIVVLALFGDDASVVLEEFVVVVLAQLEVLQDHCPVVVQVGFYLPRIAQVHPLIKYIISTTRSLQARKHADYTPIIPSKDLISLNLPQTPRNASEHPSHSFNPPPGISHKPYPFSLMDAMHCPHSYPPSFKINNSNQQHYMKTSKPKQVKTESSLEKGDDDKGRSIGRVSHSNYKKRRAAFTPIRFADIVVTKKSGEKDSRSTNDRDKSDISQPRDQQPMKNSIMQAINIFKEFSGSNSKGEDRDENKKITPFELVPEEQDIFEEELSFKGASNRITLLRKIDQIEVQTGKIVNIIKGLNYNSNLDFITQKLVKQSSKKSKNMKLSFFEFYSHLETITKRVNDFAVELDRCRQIMLKITTGISCRTLTFYTSKFETLISEMDSNVKYLQNYIELLHNIHRQEARQPNRRLTLAALHAM